MKFCGLTWETSYLESSLISWEETKHRHKTGREWGLFCLMHHHMNLQCQLAEFTSLHDLFRRICKQQLSYVNANAKPLLRFVLAIYTRSFAVQVEPKFFFFNMSPMWHEFCVVFLHFTHVFVLFGMESVTRNLFGYVNCLEEAHQHKKTLLRIFL